MAISEHLTEFHGLPVFDLFPEDETADSSALPAADAVAWRVGLHYEAARSFAECWEEFLALVDTQQVRAVVIGPWFSDDYEYTLAEPLAAITGSADQLPSLRALFLGDVTYEQCELSWLQLSDVTPALESFPLLEELVVRGASGDYEGKEGLALRPLRHERLRALRFEAGGLPAEVVRAVGASDFPALERLELWLGVSEYGGDATVADLAPFLDGARLPVLRHLGLENSELQDEIAAAVAGAPVVARLESLSLAMGILTDQGAGALLAGQPLTHLRALDLHHHFVSEELQQRLRDTLGAAGVAVDLSEHEKPHGDWRYVANAE
ncbi:STM4015 family protein [Kitasatospora azatica]|uniref:STM4015 family protein n=1 Tax=Kitasatospora azatica TaxID=58347 RepID=UPI00056A02DB|nr:STM4015 family protein [Kitasatospora azatica]